MAYGMNDVQQSFTGAVVASLLVVIIRSGSPIIMDSTKGLWIGLIWIWIITKPFITSKFETKVHAFWNIIITLVVTTILSITFDLMTMEQLSLQLFTGSSAWIIMMIAAPTALYWDKLNITSQYDRWYFKRR